jgi:hypothetical protein
MRALLSGQVSQVKLCWGEHHMELLFQCYRFCWMPLLADVHFLMGVDFLHHYHHHYYLGTNTLVDMVSA